MDIEQYWQKIYSNWYHNKSGCETCKANDEESIWSPIFGIGSDDPDVLFVGIDPGGRKGPRDHEQKRYMKNEFRHFDDLCGGENLDISKAPSPEEWARKKDPNDAPSTASEFVERLEEVDGSISITYTNVKKCPEINHPSGDHACTMDREPFNSQGKDRCSAQYLEQELSLLSPEVICTFGEARHYVLPNYGYDSKNTLKDRQELNSDGFLSAFGYKPTILPLYHFAQNNWSTVANGLPDGLLQEIARENGDSNDYKRPYQRLAAESIHYHLS